MIFTETCSCGASLTLKAWGVRDLDTAGFEEWRRNHRHDVKPLCEPPGPHDTATEPARANPKQAGRQ